MRDSEHTRSRLFGDCLHCTTIGNPNYNISTLNAYFPNSNTFRAAEKVENSPTVYGFLLLGTIFSLTLAFSVPPPASLWWVSSVEIIKNIEIGSAILLRIIYALQFDSRNDRPPLFYNWVRNFTKYTWPSQFEHSHQRRAEKAQKIKKEETHIKAFVDRI